jgi:MaoC like domain
MTTTSLPTVPSTGSVYRRAVGGLVRRHPDGAELPAGALEVADIGVTVSELAAYDRVCGFRLTDTLPATYPHVLAFPIAMHLMGDAAFPFGVIGLVHIANNITLCRPITVSERLTITVAAEHLRPHDRGQQFDIVATASTEGEEVWRGVSTYLRRSKAPDGPPSSVSIAEPPVASAIWHVGRDVGTAYAQVSGDRNPIHVSMLGAKAFGFPRPIAHGMWSAARCLAALEGELPDAYTYEVAFKRPIPLPSTVAFAQNGDETSLTSAKSGAPHLRATLTS